MSKWTETKIIFYMFIEFLICSTVLLIDVAYFFARRKVQKVERKMLNVYSVFSIP